MADILAELKQSQHWSPQFGLPVGFGLDNNPWLNLALAQKILNQNNVDLEDKAVFEWISLCRLGAHLFSRWPGGTGGLMSQDELIGMSYLRLSLALQVKWGLQRNFWCYPNDKKFPFFRSWKGRFPWFTAYVKSRANGELSLIYQAVWSVHVALSALKHGGSSEHLLIWVMVEDMQKYPMCKRAIEFWKKKRAESGLTIAHLFELFFPSDRWYSRWASE